MNRLIFALFQFGARFAIYTHLPWNCALIRDVVISCPKSLSIIPDEFKYVHLQSLFYSH